MQVYYESRYVKVAQTMRSIDEIAEKMIVTFTSFPAFRDLGQIIRDYARAAREETEIMKSDLDFFRNWPEFVSLGEQISRFKPDPSGGDNTLTTSQLDEGKQLLCEGKDLLRDIAAVRVPILISSRQYLAALDNFWSALSTNTVDNN